MLKNNIANICDHTSGEYNNSDIIVFGVPYDGTCSFRPGTRFAPTAVRDDLYAIETYSPYQDQDLKDYTFCDAGDVKVALGDTVKTLDFIRRETEQMLKDNKKTLAIGGEHLISYPIISEYIKKYPNIHVIHFDAHTDLRDEFLGEKLSHATVMKLVHNELQKGEMWQFGIRSGVKEEFEWAKKHTHMCRYDLSELESAVEKIGDAPVYLSIDLDVLDPSVFPGTGTPEPGGISFKELINGLMITKKLNIVGADIVELSPHYDHSGISTAAACKVLRELLLIMAK